MNPYFLIAITVFVSACTSTVNESQLKEAEDELYNSEIKMLKDGTKYLVHPDKLRGGGPAKDGIPSIDKPKFVTVKEADKWIEPKEFGAAIIHKGVKRFYPFQVLVWHEIVNDEVAADPVMITYCPLCGSVIGYEGQIDGERVEFGTSGKLYNSNLVMYDRKTDSYWTQIEGRAIIGELSGTELKLFPVDVVTWGDWKTAHPESEVLSRQTGHVRPYGNDPYGGYYESRSTIFPVENEDDRLHPKEVVFGIVVKGIAKAYTEKAVREAGEITDTIGNTEIIVTRDGAGIVTFTGESGQRIAHERDFWFAWFAFHPDTELHQ